MVEIKYGEHYEEADLTGKSIAEAREQYRKDFGIPDKAQAKLNGKGISQKLEAETGLWDEDELSFEEKNRKGLVMLGAFLLTLAVTAGIFVYTYTTTSATITVTAASADYASVSANATPAPYTLFGRARGAIGAATLFDVTRTSGYTGDLEVQVYLANPDELTDDYSAWMVRVELQDISGTKVDTENMTQVLSLDNPMVSFVSSSWAVPRYIKILGGSYRVLPFALGSSGADPLLFGQVVQAGP